MIVTQLFNASCGSILLPALLHFQLINPIWPDAQPYETFFFVAAAVLVVWFNRKAMFSREWGVTEVMPHAKNQVMPESAKATPEKVLKRSEKEGGFQSV